MTPHHRFVLRLRDQGTAAVLLLGLSVFLGLSMTGRPPEEPRNYRFQVDINRAGAEELMVLPGIGEKLAEGIILHREANGPFRTPEEIKGVKGIGPKKLEVIRESLAEME